LSLQDDLAADDLGLILQMWAARNLAASRPIELMLERWLYASAYMSHPKFQEMSGLFWRGSMEEERAQEFHAHWTNRLNRGIPAGRPSRAGSEWSSRIVDDRRSARGCANGRPRDESAMHRCGYVVGMTHGLSLQKRHSLLRCFFEDHLPEIVALEYGDEYGLPWSEQRLHKMAYVMAYNCDQFIRNDPERYGAAITSWVEDLEYLRMNYHAGWFDFDWPRVTVPVCA